MESSFNYFGYFCVDVDATRTISPHFACFSFQFFQFERNQYNIDAVAIVCASKLFRCHQMAFARWLVKSSLLNSTSLTSTTSARFICVSCCGIVRLWFYMHVKHPLTMSLRLACMRIEKCCCVLVGGAVVSSSKWDRRTIHRLLFV